MLVDSACHRAGFAHLDVKLENYIFQPIHRASDKQKDMKVVLIDYGSAEKFSHAVYAERGSQYRKNLDDEVEELIGKTLKFKIPY